MILISKSLASKIVTVGPDFHNHRGGIGAVIATYHSFYEVFNFVPTYKSHDNNLQKIIYFIKQSIIFCAFLSKTRKKIKIVHIHGSHTGSFYRKFFIFLIAKKIFNKKVVYHVHSDAFDSFYNNSSGLQKKIISWFINEVNAIVCLSKVWEYYFKKNFRCKKIHIINNVVFEPVSLTTFNRENIDEQAYLKFIFLGRIGDRKGIFDVVNMLIEKKAFFNGKVKLYIGGDGEIEKLSTLIKEAGLNDIVEYLGWVDNDKKNNLLLNSDVYLLPSYSEGLPVSILEAMSYGLPIISTPVGGIPEIVKNYENGILVQPGDFIALESAFRYFLDNPAKIKEYGDNSLVRISSYFPEYVSRQLQELYESL